MVTRIGNGGSNRLTGGNGADVIYGYDPGTIPRVAADAIASGLSSPLYLTSPPGNPGQLFIVEKGGLVKIHEAATGQTRATPFLDVSSQVATSGEQGLLGLAFAPDYATSRKFYVYLSNNAGDTEIREYQASASNPLAADPATMRRIVTIDYPAQTTNHRGGWIGFGPDGYLYAATGDGAVRANAQSLNHLGKILRLDVNADAFPNDSGRNYAAPADNPASIAGIGGSAVGSGIFAAGLRNPWRASFDRATGELFVGDVGEGSFEEINLGRAGANYGWSLTEGPFDPAAFPGFTNPVHAYGRSSGQAVTGGYVYRGPEAAFHGQYFFSDFATGRIWTLERANGSWSFTDLTGRTEVGGGPIGNVSSFGEDAAGNLYIVDLGGKIFRLNLSSTAGNPADDVADVLRGLDGNDRIFGGGGRDTLQGGDGTDRLSGGPGADLIQGGGGFDYAVYTDSPQGVAVDLARRTQSGGDAEGDRLSGIEGILGSAFGDVLRGASGDNVIHAGAGNDGVSGRAGDDRLSGNSGDDRINGGPGRDTMAGGSGIDTVSYAGSALGVTVDLNRSVQRSRGDAAGDVLSSFENIAGSSRADVLTGNKLANVLTGGRGNDRLSGRSGDDLLDGGPGSDRLFGGAGQDTLDGGPGRDLFRWRGVLESTVSQPDLVLDFRRPDRLDLAQIDADRTRGGNQGFAFVGTGEFTAAGQVRYAVEGAQTHVFLNVDADSQAEGMILLAGVHTLRGGDFLL
ncbi:MAG TPA: PQQ-dependent sugar dehydrogenase [Microvirga sp.]|nr:PQQ-dependent sugar dehydrogenase [Microvirga sp.]